MENSEKKIEWKTSSSLTGERGFLWYVIFFVVLWALLIFAWHQKNFLFIVLIILGGVLILFTGGNEKKEIKCLLTEKEFLINGKENVYRYEDFLGFSIFKKEEEKSFLVLYPKNPLVTNLKIHLPSDKEEEVKSFLKNKLEEREYQESWINILWEKLKL